MEHLIIFILAVIVAAGLVYHLTLSVIMWENNNPQYRSYYYVYPIPLWIAALIALLFVVWDMAFFVTDHGNTIFSPEWIVFMVIVIPADMAITRDFFIDVADMFKKITTKET
ncbi:MAG: hypothetical protein JWM92_148 [Candidatus Nomurabacteria bacterium]|nr:hypothetical protein [Candidatus Nomurabacteria bacterium]